MARFLICSFALVLLYPSGIDMYLVGLPRIAQDLGASEAHAAYPPFRFIWREWSAAMAVCGSYRR